MTPLQLKIIFNACKIRVLRGEDINEVIDSYEKLTSDERQIIFDQLTEVIEETE